MRPRVRRWLHRTQPHRHDHEDLESAVLIALLEAERRFTGTPETWPAYAWPRIKGAIFDELRRERPKGFRRRVPEGVPFPIISSMDKTESSSRIIAETIPDHSATIEHDPVSEQMLQDAVLALSTNQRMIVEMLIEQEWTMHELARTLGVTTAALVHMKGKIRVQLIDSLAHPMPRRKALKLLRSETFLRQRVETGRSVREIAAEIGVSRSSVRERMRMYGIPPTKRTLASERQRRLLS